jgi:APA family basic amino acid/polyamine antiporter
MKKLLFKDAFFLVTGTAIGSGVITLVGVGILRTGTGTCLAYIAAGILLAFALSPQIALGTVCPRNGGSYTYIKELLNPYWGAMYLVVFTIAKVGIAMFCISLAEYFINGVIGIEVSRIYIRIMAFAILTFFYVLNLLGQKITLKVQNIMTFVLIVALFSFVIIGLCKVKFTGTGAFTARKMFPNGFSGFISATSVLVFSVIGGTLAIDYGTNIENPKRNIPILVFSVMIGCALLNAIIALIAAVAAPLTMPTSHLLYAAKAIGGSVYQTTFVLCGAVLALATTINGNFSWFGVITSRGVDDGYLPKALAKTNKYGAKFILYTIVYAMAVLVLLLDIETVLLANMATGLSLLFTLFPNIAMLFARKKYAEEWSKSKLPQSQTAVITWVAVSTAIATYLVVNTVRNYTKPTLIVVGCVFVIGIIYAIIVGNKVKNAKSMEIVNTEN